MCGIAGILRLNGGTAAESDQIGRMLAAIDHRGPDESGTYRDPQVTLGHARLSIIDLDQGRQPICNEDGNLWIVYNGEAYNYIELKKELKKQGHRFRTDTDTEVVLHLYEQYGPECLSRINGQFALAIWDKRRQSLFLARDRLGIRPLFYTHTAGQLLFASEIKALFEDPLVERAIDPQALLQIFTFWTTLTPKTAFKNILSLPPGHYLLASRTGTEIRAWWRLPYYPKSERWPHGYGAALEQLSELLRDAVRIRLRADVPVGAYLSGGLDSSVISAMIARYYNNRLRTFSIGFENPDYDETHYQEEMRDALKVEHDQIQITPGDLCRHLPAAVWHCETPLLRTAPVPLLQLSRLVQGNRFKVVLTGEGADEIFGGYNIYKEAKIRAFWAKNPNSQLRPLLLKKLYPYVFEQRIRNSSYLRHFFAVSAADRRDPLFSHRVRWRNGSKLSAFFGPDLLAELKDYDPFEEAAQRLPEGFNTRDLLSKAQLLETEIFLSNYLLSSQGDRVAMANALEIRLPFLDYRIVDLAARLPAHWKINGLNEKYILKDLARGLVPDAIRGRPKQPYRAPVREAFCRPEGPDYIDRLLSETALKRSAYFKPTNVGLLLRKLRNPGNRHTREIDAQALIGVLTTQLLHAQFIDRSGWDPVTL